MNEFLYSISSISILQIILCASLLISAIMVNLSSNPVESVLFLVLTFITSGILLMALLSEFFGITVIIIYVGAIAVLFLFVIMMLNIKDYNLGSNSSLFQSKVAKFCLSSSLLYLISVFFGYKTEDVFSTVQIKQDLFLVDQLDNIEVLGQVLYNYYIECFLIAGLLLLVALIGAIVLTLTYSNTKKGQQLPNRQLSRSDKFLSFFE